MSSAIGKRRRELPSTSSPPGSAASEFSSVPQPAPKRPVRRASTWRAAALGDDEPPEISPEDEQELLEALRADDTSHSGSTARRLSPSANDPVVGDPADVKTWFPGVPEAASGLPPRLYPWQAQCLAVPGVARGTRSLVYAAPTSGGKTLVAEILMLKAILAKGKVLFVQPFVALVKEKELSMKTLLRPIDKRVSAFYGRHRPHLRFDAAICARLGDQHQPDIGKTNKPA